VSPPNQLNFNTIIYNEIMINNIKIEICIGNIDDAILASKYPIDRIELNSALELGGLTPSLNTLITLKDKIDTPLCCMVRPRTGDFEYTDLEFETMLKDAKLLLDNKADGIVFGFNKNKKVDVKRTKQMVDLIHSYNREAIFHKAFDELDNLEEGIQTLIDLKVDRILTSGGKQDIIEGSKIVGELHQKYGHKIQLLPGGGVRINNIKNVIELAQSKQVHMTSKRSNPNKSIELEEEQLVQLLKQLEGI